MFEARWFQIVLVECELALAVVLLVGIAPRTTWLASTFLFSIFTIASLTKGLNGAESCGCFGAATVNPWYTFVLAAGIVVSLILFKPQRSVLSASSNKNINSDSTWLIHIFGITVILTLVVTAQIYLFFGSFVGLNNYIPTSDITFEIDDTFQPPKGDAVRIIVRNKTFKPITIVGAKAGCKCVKIIDIPVRIPANSLSYVSFVASEGVDRIDKAKKKQTIIFFIDANNTQKAIVELPLFEFLARR